MKIFADTASTSEIQDLVNKNLIDGVTTNPSLIAKSSKKHEKVIAEICEIIDGPVSAEVNAISYQDMITEGTNLALIAKNIVIKLPITSDGLRACSYFSKKNIKTNMTLCFSLSQALLSAKMGATYVSPFVGRLDDIVENGISFLNNIVLLYKNYKFNTKILAASIRNVPHTEQAALAGADAATVPYKVIKELSEHPLTKKGLDIFLKDYIKTSK